MICHIPENYIASSKGDYNINCHKDCKDSVVVECHRRDKSGE